MPLYKRTPFSRVEPPKDLEPHELVYQVRFTKEIFRDYQEYLNRINLYRLRVWTCKVTAKTNLTYEEALVSEQRATEKVQQFPKDLVAPVLNTIQFSTLTLVDLVSTICRNLQDSLLEGLELYVRKGHSVCSCKILKVLEDSDKLSYEVGFLDKDKKVTDSSVVSADDLVRKKLPFSRDVLKSFIRESTCQSTPWILHERLARQYGISTEVPEELQDKASDEGESGGRKKVRMKNSENKRTKMEEKQGENNKRKRKKSEPKDSEKLITFKKAKKEEEKPIEEPIKYPIDDLLVQPAADDPVFTDRPSPSRDFGVQMDCVGGLIMAWDFCTSFSKLLNLWPFSLEDFQNAICHKDQNLTLIMESHSAILRLLIKEEGKYFTAIQKKNRKGKITLVTWTNYLCDFLEMVDIPEVSTSLATIRRGHYGLLETHTKLGIFRELVNHALETDIFREQLDIYIEQRQELASTRREIALQEGRKRREKKELQKAGSVGKEEIVQNGEAKLHISENGDLNGGNGQVSKKRDGDLIIYKRKKKVAGNRENNDDDMASKNVAVKQKMAAKPAADHVKDSSSSEERNKALKQRIKNKEKETLEAETNENKVAKTNPSLGRVRFSQSQPMDPNSQKDQLDREMEKRFVRTSPLGKDKNYNRYWFFGHDGRIFVESSDSKLWGYYSSKEELDALIGSLNPKGERERALKKQLKKSYQRICKGLEKRSKYIAHKIAMEEAVVRRSTRVRAPRKDNPAMAFLNYVNKWKDN